MSSALAIAAVTAVLKDLLGNGISAADLAAAGVGDAGVSALSPDRIPVTEADEPNRLNLFMYQATPNAAWRNTGMPMRDARGERISNPPLALDLYYLLTAYGTTELNAEMLLGHGMQLLHETSGLGREAIRRALNPTAPGGSASPTLQALAAAELAEQIELIKICPHTLNGEELSKLWTAFQAHYRPSAAYQVSVVLIEARRPTRAVLPVRERVLHVLPFRPPTIESLEPQIVSLTPGAELSLRGFNLRADDMRVRVGGSEITPEPGSTDQQLVVRLPADLRAGINAVQVLHRLTLGSPPARTIFESNIVAGVIRPLIRKQAADPNQYDIEVDDVSGTGDEARSARITLRINPRVGKRQRVVLLLNQVDPPGGLAHAYSFDAPSRDQPAAPETTDTLSIPIAGVAPGDYLLRVQVDGAQSPLDEDGEHRFIAPRVTIP